MSWQWPVNLLLLQTCAWWASRDLCQRRLSKRHHFPRGLSQHLSAVKPGMFEICQCSSDCCIFCFFYFDEKKHISYLTVAFVCQWLSGYISELVTCTGEDWFCSPDCATSDSQRRDAVLDYSRSVTCHGLLDMCHRDAVREADGQAMMTIWRVNMPRFWGGRHFKYLRVGHRLLAGIEFYNGCLYDATKC